MPVLIVYVLCGTETKIYIKMAEIKNDKTEDLIFPPLPTPVILCTLWGVCPGSVKPGVPNSGSVHPVTGLSGHGLPQSVPLGVIRSCLRAVVCSERDP